MTFKFYVISGNKLWALKNATSRLVFLERKMELERIIRSQGFGSRPESRVLIRSGKVTVEGNLCVDPSAEFTPENLNFGVDGMVLKYRKFAYLMLNKPSGYECSHKPKFHASVYSLLPEYLLARGVQAVGRLDEDTTGLLLFSDDGQFIHTYTSPKKKVSKVYEVSVKQPVDEFQIASLLAGVQLNDEPRPIAAMACELHSERVLRLTVTEGKYHLIKRMIAVVGNHVERLNRISIGALSLPNNLLIGNWTWLEMADQDQLSFRP